MLERKLISEKGSLKVELIQNPNDPIWEKFYEVYCQAFPMKEEREPLENLKRYHQFNLDGSFGPDNDPLARTNSFILQKNKELVTVYIMGWLKLTEHYSSVFGSYLFTSPEHKNQGLATTLIEQVEDFLVEQAKRTEMNLIGLFAEINDPEKMDSETLALDKKIMDPKKRVAFWRNQGYKRLDAYYEQPTLTTGGDPVTYLDLYFKPKMSDFTENLSTDLFFLTIQKFFQYFFIIPDLKKTQSYQKIKQDVEGKTGIKLI